MCKYLLSLFVLVGFSQLCLGTAAHSASIEIKNGFVILHASVNGKAGLYILDSGAPGLVVNKKYYDSDLFDKGTLHSIHGNVDMSVVQNWSFQWNGFAAIGNEAYAIDLTYLERAVDEKIEGLVGIDVFEGYYMVVDYAQQSLQLWNTMPDLFKRNVFAQLDIEMQGHVPIVTLHHKSRPFRFAFDSGSGAHILDMATVTHWKNDVKYLNAIDIVGADQNVIRTKKIKASGLMSNGIALPPTDFVITDLSTMKSATDSHIDGILGQPLFEGRIILIDRDRKFIRLSQIFIQESATREMVAATAYLMDK